MESPILPPARRGLDVEDLKLRAAELGDFVVAAAERTHPRPSNLTAVGFSNGANIASALPLCSVPKSSSPERCSIRAMVPLVPDSLPALRAPVLISHARADPLVLARRDRAARVPPDAAPARTSTSRGKPGGHQLSQGDFTLARDWLARAPISGPMSETS